MSAVCISESGSHSVLQETLCKDKIVVLCEYHVRLHSQFSCLDIWYQERSWKEKNKSWMPFYQELQLTWTWTEQNFKTWLSFNTKIVAKTHRSKIWSSFSHFLFSHYLICLVWTCNSAEGKITMQFLHVIASPASSGGMNKYVSKFVRINQSMHGLSVSFIRCFRIY